jgi:hypothetical protein
LPPPTTRLWPLKAGLNLDAAAPETSLPPTDQDDLGLAALLDGDFESADDELDLDPDFDTENLDLDALLNPPAPDNTPDNTSDDLLDSLDDFSDLS